MWFFCTVFEYETVLWRIRILLLLPALTVRSYHRPPSALSYVLLRVSNVSIGLGWIIPPCVVLYTVWEPGVSEMMHSHWETRSQHWSKTVNTCISLLQHGKQLQFRFSCVYISNCDVHTFFISIIYNHLRVWNLFLFLYLFLSLLIFCITFRWQHNAHRNSYISRLYSLTVCATSIW